ncbi:MAG: Uma2 family endonuclease [Thermaceae bacterium]|nr:Uma2 family endonuclease [Thermaceae bacterium]
MFALKQRAEPEGKGYTSTEEGVIIERDPDRVHGSDVLFLSADKLTPENGSQDSFWDVQPDGVAEVVSRNEGAHEVRRKLRDYLSIGTRLVLLIYPSTKEVEVHTPGGPAKTYYENDTLEFSEVLPGFRLEVAKLFQSIPGK